MTTIVHEESCGCTECQSKQAAGTKSGPVTEGTPTREYMPLKGKATLAIVAMTAFTAVSLFFSGITPIIAFIVAGVLFLRWLARASMNLQSLGTETQKFSPSATVLSWFIPVANLLMPYLVVKEIWKGSHPDEVPNSDDGQRTPPMSPLIGPWWITWIVAELIGYAAFPQWSYDTLSNGQIVADAVMEGSLVVSLVLVVILTQQITKNQERKYAQRQDQATA